MIKKLFGYTQIKPVTPSEKDVLRDVLGKPAKQVAWYVEKSCDGSEFNVGDKVILMPYANVVVVELPGQEKLNFVKNTEILAILGGTDEN